MKRISFDTTQVYNCDNGMQSQAVRFYGMSGDNFVFIPCHPTKKHYCGVPCTLSENEAKAMIKPYQNKA